MAWGNGDRSVDVIEMLGLGGQDDEESVEVIDMLGLGGQDDEE